MSQILIVDDEESVRFVLRMCLQEAHSIKECSNGREALDLLNTFVADLVITDLNMPDLDGLELIQAIRKKREHMPIIAITGALASNSMLSAAKHFGANATLLKPFSASELIATATALLPSG